MENEKDCQTGKVSTFASEMTKWFDTNYHFIVPEFRADTQFSLSSSKVFDEFGEAKALGHQSQARPCRPGHYLSLGKSLDSKNPDFAPLDLLDNGCLAVYEAIIARLAAEVRSGSSSTSRSSRPTSARPSGSTRDDLRALSLRTKGSAEKLLVATYFGPVKET